MVLGPANNLPPDLFLRDEAATNQASQMKGQSRCRQVETGLYFADVEAWRAGPNEEPIDVQAGQVAQFGEAACGEFSVHGAQNIARQGIYNHITGFIVVHSGATTSVIDRKHAWKPRAFPACFPQAKARSAQ